MPAGGGCRGEMKWQQIFFLSRVRLRYQILMLVLMLVITRYGPMGIFNTLNFILFFPFSGRQKGIYVTVSCLLHLNTIISASPHSCSCYFPGGKRADLYSVFLSDIYIASCYRLLESQYSYFSQIVGLSFTSPY